MEGARLKAERAHDLVMMGAWHTAIFGLNGYSGGLKGKSLSDYLISGSKPQHSKAAQALAFFQEMKARGLPVSITRVERKQSPRPQEK